MLKDPIVIKNLAVNNRLVMPPVDLRKADADDTVSEEMLRHYKAIAQTGIGMIFIEHTYVDPAGKVHPNQLASYDDKFIAGLNELASTLHACGDVKVVDQINHGGSRAHPDDPDTVPGAPSAVINPRNPNSMPRELTVEEIHDITKKFAEAAVRIKKAGFDGVEIHSAHGFLLTQFLSPLTNKRNDQYGGSLENRLRIHKEIIQSVREAVGSDYLISMRLGGPDYLEGGSELNDIIEAGVLLEQYGLDLISVSGGMLGHVRPDRTEPGYFKDISIPIKERVSIPVVLSGGVIVPQDAEDLLNENAADLIGVGREMVKDPSWAEAALK